MSRLSTLFAGVTLITALTYQSRINLISNTANVQKEVDELKVKVDRMASTDDGVLQSARLSLRRPNTSVENVIDNTKIYYKQRLVPSVKDSWNAQVIAVSVAMIQLNLPSKCKQMIMQSIFGVTP